MVSTQDVVNEKIRSAFLKLLDDKTYKKITFKELATESGMTRQNLYYYYKSKEYVLEDIIEEFFDRLYDAMLEYSANRVETDEEEMGKALIRVMVEALKENEEVARCFFSRDVNIIFINKSVGFLHRLLGRMIRLQHITVNDPKYIHYLALQIAGACYLPLREWLLVDRDFPTDRIVELAYPMLEQIIQSLKNN